MAHIKRVNPSITTQTGKRKQGKGFSINELKAAGVSKQQAKLSHLPVDERRKSQHEENVATIKAQVQKTKI